MSMIAVVSKLLNQAAAMDQAVEAKAVVAVVADKTGPDADLQGQRYF